MQYAFSDIYKYRLLGPFISLRIRTRRSEWSGYLHLVLQCASKWVVIGVRKDCNFRCVRLFAQSAY